MDSEPGKARWMLTGGTQRKCLGEVIQAPPTQGKSRPQCEDTASVTALLAVDGRDPAENS